MTRRFNECEYERIFILFVVVTVCLNPCVEGIAIDNEVIGIPQVQCSEDAVTFAVRTRNAFTGNIYIKGKFNEPACRQEFFSNSFNGASYTVRIPLCGMRRIRQLQPQGMNYILVFVVSFHPQFNTKIDRAYNVRCFYAQQEKTVTSQLEVSMMSTQSLEAATMLMPNCEYSIRSGSLNGPRVRYVRVGERLVHRWECDNPNFGMLIKNCFVNDGFGSSVRVLDSRGCPVFSPVIQGPLQYDNSLNLAYVEVWAYKFPDRQDLYFQCQVQVCNKRENECVGITPPNCPLNPIPPGQGPPSSIVEPPVTGPYGPVTVIRGTFERPFGGQELVGPYVPGAVVGPVPAPYGPPFGQQVLPGFSQYVPGVQPSFGGQQQVLGGAQIGVGYPGAPVPGAANDQRVNANGVPPANAASGESNAATPNRIPDQQTTGQLHSTTSGPSGTPALNAVQPHQPARQFNSDVRNDDSDQRQGSNSSTTPSGPNATSPAVQPLQLFYTGNSTQGQRRPRISPHSQQQRRKSRREADSEMANGKDYDPDGSSSTLTFVTRPAKKSSHSDSASATPGDSQLMDVTADVVYVADVGDNEFGDDLKRYPFAAVSMGETKQVCLNPLAFSLLFTCFAVLVLVIALLLIYVLMRSGRWPVVGKRAEIESGGMVDGEQWAGAGMQSTLSSTPKMNTTDSSESNDCNNETVATISGHSRWLSLPGNSKKGGLWPILPFRLPRFDRKRQPIL